MFCFSRMSRAINAAIRMLNIRGETSPRLVWSATFANLICLSRTASNVMENQRKARMKTWLFEVEQRRLVLAGAA